MTEDFTETVIRIINAIRPILAGKPPPAQGAALAELLATFLAGHMIEGSPSETKRLRKLLLKAHLETVHALIEEDDRAHRR